MRSFANKNDDTDEEVTAKRTRVVKAKKDEVDLTSPKKIRKSKKAIEN